MSHGSSWTSAGVASDPIKRLLVSNSLGRSSCKSKMMHSWVGDVLEASGISHSEGWRIAKEVIKDELLKSNDSCLIFATAYVSSVVGMNASSVIEAPLLVQ